MKKLILFGIIFALLFGCCGIIGRKTSKEKLYSLVKEAPAGAEMVVYIDLEKLAKNPVVLEKANLPNESKYLTIFVKSMGTIRRAEDKQVIILDIVGVDLIGGFIPFLLSQEDERKVEFTQTQYKGFTIYESEELSFFTTPGRIYFGNSSAELKKIIDVKKGGANALSEYSGILGELPDGDVLLVGRMDVLLGGRMGAQIPMEMGVSATSSLDIVEATIVVDAKQPLIAQGMLQRFKPGTEMGGIKVLSATTSGNYLIIRAETEIENIGARGSALGGEAREGEKSETQGREMRTVSGIRK